LFSLLRVAAVVLHPLRWFEQSCTPARGVEGAWLMDLHPGDRVIVASCVGFIPFGAAGTVVSVHKAVRPSTGRSAFEQTVRCLAVQRYPGT
jgi:hypothetical protein